jgi:hypothetical protein
MMEEEIVHLPELSLRAGGLRGFGCLLGVIVADCDGEVPVDKSQLRSVRLQQLPNHRVGSRAMGALEVAVLHQGYRGIKRAEHVVSRGDRDEKRLGHAGKLPWFGAEGHPKTGVGTPMLLRVLAPPACMAITGRLPRSAPPSLVEDLLSELATSRDADLDDLAAVAPWAGTSQPAATPSAQ